MADEEKKVIVIDDVDDELLDDEELVEEDEELDDDEEDDQDAESEDEDEEESDDDESDVEEEDEQDSVRDTDVPADEPAEEIPQSPASDTDPNAESEKEGGDCREADVPTGRERGRKARKDEKDRKDSTAKQVVRCICNYPHWLATSIVHWFTGTEEHPLPFLGLRDRLRCWWLSRHGYAYIRRLSFNRKLKIWEIQEDFDKRRGFPLEAVHCTNERGVFLLPIDEIKFDPREDFGFGAHNAFNYMKDNSFEEAQMAAGQEKQGIPLKYLGIFAIGAIAIGMYAMTIMG